MSNNTHTDNEEHKNLRNRVSDIIRWNGFNLSNDEAVKELMDYVEANYTPKTTAQAAVQGDELIDFVNRHGYTGGDNELRQMIEGVCRPTKSSGELEDLKYTLMHTKVDAYSQGQQFHVSMSTLLSYGDNWKVIMSVINAWHTTQTTKLQAEAAAHNTEQCPRCVWDSGKNILPVSKSHPHDCACTEYGPCLRHSDEMQKPGLFDEQLEREYKVKSDD